MVNKNIKQLSKAVANIKNIEKATNLVKTIPQSNEFKLALLNNGISEQFVAEKLKEAMEAVTLKIDDKRGLSFETPDNAIRLKAIEMWINVFGYREAAKPAIAKEGTKHVHLHGLSKEELDDAVRAASIGDDQKKGS